jgi:DNA-binding SARP family transcriptional activator/tetratricopeptide (TPR) repeat protein
VIYRLLGELQIGQDGQLTDLPVGLTLVVLAALLINANRRISKADLIRTVWGSDDVREAQLHKRVMAVRDVLGQAGRRDDLRTHSRFGYELRVADDDVDALLFQRLVRQAQEAAAEHRGADEIGCLRRALGLWRGPHPLSNVPTEALRQETLALEQRHRRAAVRLFGLELGRGNHELVLDELISVAGFYPADGRLAEQLVLAQYWCGHLTDAATAYERHREALAQETGGTPEALLRTFHFAIARGDQKAAAAAESQLARRAVPLPRPPSPRRPGGVPRQLPRPPELVARDDLAAEATWLLRRDPAPAVPVVVISGPGGIGKTALAVRVAHDSMDHYPDGQLYLELHGSRDGAAATGEILAQILRAFEVSRVPETKAERLAAYRTLLADRRVLVVLDDVADGMQVSELVPANPGCAVLVTARQRLPEISDAHHMAPLEPLEPAAATRLFLSVVQRSGLRLDHELDAVGQVVALCGGLPLALRIAGALRVRDQHRPTADLARRLAAQGPAAFEYRDLNVARTIGAGFERLDTDAGRLFLGLGALPLTGFGLWTAVAVLDGSADDAAAALAQLAASFMITSGPAEARHGLHDLTREYARRRALAGLPGDHSALAAQVYRALLTLVRRAHVRLYKGDFEVIHSAVADWRAPPEVLSEVDADPLEWFEKELPNIRTAVDHCAALGLTDICWDLAVSAHELYNVGGYFDDWYATHEVALAACQRSGSQRGEGIVLACLNQPALVASRRAASTSGPAELERAVSLLAAAGDQHGQAIALRTLANALRRRGHLTRPLRLLSEALALYAAAGDVVGQWQALRFIGQSHLELGNDQDARRALADAAVIADELGVPRLIAQAQYWVGAACLAVDDLAGAQIAFGKVLEVCSGRPGIGLAYAQHGQGELALRRGDYDAAARHLAMAAERAQAGSDAVLEGRVLMSVASLEGARGQPAGQVAALNRAVAVFTGCGAARQAARALAELASFLSGRGDAVAASAAWARVEALYEEAGLPAEDRLRRPGG